MWSRLAPDLWARGVLTAWDLDTFAAYCGVVVQVRRAERLLEPGLILKGRRDPAVTNPAWRIYRDSLVLLRAYAMEFGLTPASRSQLRALPGPRSGSASSALPG